MRCRAKAAPLALLVLAAVGALALVTYFNASQWAVNATLAPVSKNLNWSVYPLTKAWYHFEGSYNVTYYYAKFMPGWPETYTVGIFAARDAGWQARFEVIDRSGNPGGTYTISLGGAAQITNTQNAGPYVSTTAPLVWSMAATGRYSILATAQFNKGGIYVTQLVNFTAEPMSHLAQWTFSCDQSQIYDSFSYCTTVGYGFDQQPAWVKFYYYGGNSKAYRDTGSGNPAPSAYLEGQNGWGAVFINVSDWLGPVPVDNAFSSQIYMQAEITGTDYIQIHFFIDTDGDGRPDLEKIYYYSDRGRSPTPIAQTMYGYALLTDTVLLDTSFPKRQWTTVSRAPGGVGHVVGYAVAIYSPNGNTKGWVDNIGAYQCSLPSNVETYASQGSLVYIDSNVSPTSPPSLATVVAPSGGVGYAVAQYWLSQPVPVLGTSLSVWGRYVRNAGDVQNNTAYVSVGVDTDGDGAVDREYIFYRSDGPTTIISAFISPGAVVCQGTCVDTAQYGFYSLGTMADGSSYQWHTSLSGPGAVLAVAMAAVDGGGSGGFKVYWDDLTVRYSACPPPGGWSGSGYAWASYDYLLVTAGGTAYTPLVSGALTYVANFTGKGKYVALTPSLGEAFGLYLRGSSAGCVYGFYSPLSRWVELRPLAALGDVIARDSTGGVLARFGCSAPPSAQYIGFRAGPGEYLIVRTVEVWG